ncbi:MAG: HEAT repeat domain-containing protein [Planctomycetes bacterium]|nr:HEAT repeat domain-containing protein [Planctomycetota bacterium]
MSQDPLLVKIKFSEDETGWAQPYEANLARIANIPVCGEWNVDDVVELETDADGWRRPKRLVARVYPKKVVLCYRKQADFHRLEALLTVLGARVEGVAGPAEGRPGRLLVACPEEIDPARLAEAVGIPQAEKAEGGRGAACARGGPRAGSGEGAGGTGAPRLEDLVARLADPDPSARARALAGLGRLRAKAAIPRVLPLLEDPHPGVRASATRALGALQAKEHVAHLLPLLQDADEEVQVAAADAVLRLGPVEDALRLLESRNPRVRARTVFSLGALPEEERVRRLRPAFADAHVDVRQAALETAAHTLSAGLAPDIARLLEDAACRRAAARTLGLLGAIELATEVAALLQQEDPYVRATAAEALGEMGATEHVAEIAGLRQDAHAPVRRAVVGALAELGGPDALPAVLAALRDPEVAVRGQAAEALDRLGGREHVDALLPLLADAGWGARFRAVGAVGHLGGAGHAEAVEKLLLDPKSEVRLAAATALLGLDASRSSAGGGRMLVALEKGELERAGRLDPALARLLCEPSAAASLARLLEGREGEALPFPSLEDALILDLLAKLREPDAHRRLWAAMEMARPLRSVEDATRVLSGQGLQLLVPQDCRFRGRLSGGVSARGMDVLARIVRRGALVAVPKGDTVRVLSEAEAVEHWRRRLGGECSE